MKAKRIRAWGIVSLIAFALTGCGQAQPVQPPLPLHAASGTSSPMVVAEVKLQPKGSSALDASATLLFNREDEALSVSLEATHLTPRGRYEVALLTAPGPSGGARTIGAFQANAQGGASYVTVVEQVQDVPTSGWRVELLTNGHVVAEGAAHVVPTAGQLPSSLPGG
ncbi:hypothetical protein [Alicyclobacillus vulcanalis]|uniref:Lipoprotein n=1 Tax=Alicyclobacillus vulcanalis TaxID=252246 RepID=A0A1N7JLL9_9BACL|nr:hypothetical protein [Alicyclobacillus vulcanalis]SIS50262.1 hypothetical protein SAMN05421799_10159 [Alicyclobacillus vulcanalis]